MVFEDQGDTEGRRGSIQEKNRDSGVTDGLNTVFDLLRTARRRYLLYYLYDMDTVVTTFEEAVDAVRAYEAAGTDTDSLPPRQRIRVDLAHNQIPRLEEAGVIEYDRRQETVRFQKDPSVEEWLEHARYLECV